MTCIWCNALPELNTKTESANNHCRYIKILRSVDRRYQSLCNAKYCRVCLPCEAPPEIKTGTTTSRNLRLALSEHLGHTRLHAMSTILGSTRARHLSCTRKKLCAWHYQCSNPFQTMSFQVLSEPVRHTMFLDIPSVQGSTRAWHETYHLTKRNLNKA